MPRRIYFFGEDINPPEICTSWKILFIQLKQLSGNVEIDGFVLVSSTAF